MGEDEESDGSPTESEFENDDDGSDNHHPDVTEPVPKKSRRDSAPKDDSNLSSKVRQQPRCLPSDVAVWEDLRVLGGLLSERSMIF